MSEPFKNHTDLPDEVFALANVRAKQTGKGRGWRYYDEAQADIDALAALGFHVVHVSVIEQLANTHTVDDRPRDEREGAAGVERSSWSQAGSDPVGDVRDWADALRRKYEDGQS